MVRNIQGYSLFLLLMNGDVNLIMGKKATPIVGDFVIQSVRSNTENRGQHSNYTLKILNRDISAI